MGRQTWVTRDAEGNVVSSTEVRSSSGCGGCLALLAGIVLVVGPAAWAANGEIPMAVAVAMYLVEALVGLAALDGFVRRRAVR
jgi:hypothetical protein